MKRNPVGHRRRSDQLGSPAPILEWHGASTVKGHEELAMKNFRVGRHEVRVWVLGARWFASVDGHRVPGWYPERVEACAAGVRTVAWLDTSVAP